MRRSVPFVALAPAFRDLLVERLPARPRLGGDLAPLALDLVVGGPFAPPDAAELIVDLAAGRLGLSPSIQSHATMRRVARDACVTLSV